MSDRIWWCETHKSPHVLDMCLRGEVQDEAGEPCKLVEKRLADPDALIVEKVEDDGSYRHGWPDWAIAAVAEVWFDSSLLSNSTQAARMLLDALAAASGEDR